MHESFEKGQESNKEVERVVDNLLLIKILKKIIMKSIDFQTPYKNIFLIYIIILNLVSLTHFCQVSLLYLCFQQFLH